MTAINAQLFKICNHHFDILVSIITQKPAGPGNQDKDLGQAVQ